MMELPPFPVDDATLDLLLVAINPWENGDPEAEQSGVGEFLMFMSQMGGSDTEAIEEVVNDGSDGGPSIYVMRDPEYTVHDVLTALIDEIKRLRGDQANG